MPTSPTQERAARIEEMRAEHYDLVVIGGGVTGAGIARDAALRGFKVALVERQDFASGASGNSARLVHGGLRYLETLEFGVVLRCCAERRRLDAIAPHLVRPLPITLPIYLNRSRFNQVRLGLWIYDALGLYRNVQNHQQLSASELARLEPPISQQDWVGAVRYVERCADDARLTLSTILAAARLGAQTLNYAEVEGLLKARGGLAGV